MVVELGGRQVPLKFNITTLGKYPGVGVQTPLLPLFVFSSAFFDGGLKVEMFAFI